MGRGHKEEEEEEDAPEGEEEGERNKRKEREENRREGREDKMGGDEEGGEKEMQGGFVGRGGGVPTNGNVHLSPLQDSIPKPGTGPGMRLVLTLVNPLN